MFPFACISAAGGGFPNEKSSFIAFVLPKSSNVNIEMPPIPRNDGNLQRNPLLMWTDATIVSFFSRLRNPTGWANKTFYYGPRRQSLVPLPLKVRDQSCYQAPFCHAP